MSKGNSGFLSFLKSLNQYAARSGKEMEDLIFTYPSSAIVKAGTIIEEIISDVFKIEQINESNFSSLSPKIFHLYKHGYIKRELYNSFTSIRKERNVAAHDSSNHSLIAAFLCHEELYKIAVWYFESYGEPDKQIPLYEIPKPKQPNISEIMTGEIREELSKVIESVAKSKLEVTGTTQPTIPEKPHVRNKKEPSKSLEINNRDDHDIDNGPSLLDVLTRLKDSSHEAIENADQFSDFKKYLHVNRQIQKDLEQILIENKDSTASNLILLCGSVGDGKSHLLAYLNEERPELVNQYKIFNDATESNAPTMDAMESLEKNLKAYSDQLIERSNEKVILAINMGVLHNFINREHEHYTYNKLREFVENSKLFTEEITTTFYEEDFNLISFGDYHYYELTESGPTSSFYESLLNRIVSPAKGNPFYDAFLRDQKKGQYSIVHLNFKFLKDENVRKQIIQLVIGAIIEQKLVISARAFLNFIADIIIPDYSDVPKAVYSLGQLKYTLPNLVFNRGERSEILKVIKKSDPIHVRLEEVDDIYIKINTYEQLEQLAKEYNLNENSRELLLPFLKNTDLKDSEYSLGVKTFVRTLLLTNEIFSEKLLDTTVKEYLFYVYAFNIKDDKYIKRMYEMVRSCINLWQGHIDGEYTFIEKGISNYKIAQRLNFKPDIAHLKARDDSLLKSFRPTIQLMYTDEERKKIIELDIDYPLFKLLKKVDKGYLPNKGDQEDAVMFAEFIDKIISLGQKKDEVLIHYVDDKKDYLLRRDDFGGYVFESRL